MQLESFYQTYFVYKIQCFTSLYL